MLRQHRFQLVVGDFIPQRLAFHFVGVDVSRAGNMVQQIKLRRAPGRFYDFPFTRGRGCHRFTLLELVDPLRIDQLFKVRQTLQAVRGLQGIAEQRDSVISGFLQARFHRLVGAIVAVQRDRRRRRKLMLFSPARQLFVAHCVKPAGRKVERCGFMPGRTAEGLRPAVVERAGAGVDRRTVLRLKLGQRE